MATGSSNFSRRTPRVFEQCQQDVLRRQALVDEQPPLRRRLAEQRQQRLTQLGRLASSAGADALRRSKVLKADAQRARVGARGGDDAAGDGAVGQKGDAEVLGLGASLVEALAHRDEALHRGIPLHRPERR